MYGSELSDHFLAPAALSDVSVNLFRGSFVAQDKRAKYPIVRAILEPSNFLLVPCLESLEEAVHRVVWNVLGGASGECFKACRQPRETSDLSD
jgi:hypothetical protein